MMAGVTPSVPRLHVSSPTDYRLHVMREGAETGYACAMQIAPTNAFIRHEVLP